MKGTQIIIGKDEHQKAFFIGLSKFMDIINKELSKNYSQGPIGKHIKILGGYAFKSTEYKSEGIPVIRISDFQDEKIDLSNVKYYRENKEYDKYQLFEGDIIIALTGGTIGKLGIVQKGLGKLYLNQRVGKFLVLHPKEFYDKYVYWLARGVQEKVKSFGYGGAQPNISGSQIEEIQFSIPDKAIQEKIVEFLEDLKNNKIQNKKYFNKETEKRIVSLLIVIEGILTSQNLQTKNTDYISSLRQQILQEAVQGKLVKQDPKDEPASELLKKIKAEKEKLIKEGKIKKQKPLPPISEDEIPYELPRGWGWVRLGGIFKTSTGGTPNRSISAYYGGETPWLKSGELNDNLNINQSEETINEEGLKNSSAKIFKKGSLILALYGATAGKLGILGFDATTNQAVCNFERNKFVENMYLFYFLRSLREKILSEGFGGAQPNISQDYVKKLLFPLPPLLEQKRIVEKVDKLMTSCDELEKQVKENQRNSEKLMEAVLKESFK